MSVSCFPTEIEWLFQFLVVCQNPRALNRYKSWRKKQCIEPGVEPWLLISSAQQLGEDNFDLIFYVTDGRRVYKVRDTEYYPWNKNKTNDLTKRTGEFHFVYVEGAKGDVRKKVLKTAVEWLNEI